MDIYIDVSNSKEIDSMTMKKMAFFYNAIQDGWSIKRTKGDKYVFTKNHEGRKEVFDGSYLTEFIKSNMDMDKLSSR
jgi:hypothetical protein